VIDGHRCMISRHHKISELLDGTLVCVVCSVVIGNCRNKTTFRDHQEAKSLENEKKELDNKLVKSEAEEKRLKEINDELNVKLERARAELEQVKAQLALKIKEAEELVRKNSVNEAVKADLREKLEEARKEKSKSLNVYHEHGRLERGNNMKTGCRCANA